MNLELAQAMLERNKDIIYELADANKALAKTQTSSMEYVEKIKETTRAIEELKKQMDDPALSGDQYLEMANKVNDLNIELGGYKDELGKLVQLEVDQISHVNDLKKTYEENTVSMGEYNLAPQLIKILFAVLPAAILYF